MRTNKNVVVFSHSSFNCLSNYWEGEAKVNNAIVYFGFYNYGRINARVYDKNNKKISGPKAFKAIKAVKNELNERGWQIK